MNVVSFVLLICATATIITIFGPNMEQAVLYSVYEGIQRLIKGAFKGPGLFFDSLLHHIYKGS